MTVNKSVAAVVGMLAVCGGTWAEDTQLPITVKKGGSATRGAGIAMHRERPDISAGKKLSFLGKYEPGTDRIRLLDPPWVHVRWKRPESWRIYCLGSETVPRSSEVVSEYLDPPQADVLQTHPAIRSFIKETKAGRSPKSPRLSLHEVYAGEVPKQFAALDAHKTMVGVYCDDLGDSRPAPQQAFQVKPGKKPAPLHPGMIAVFTGEIHVNRPEMNYHQKKQKGLHHFDLKLIETRPLKVTLDEKTAHQAYRDLVVKAEQRLQDTCKGEGLTFQFDPKAPLRTTWLDEQMVVSGLITARPDYSRKPVPYATASVFFDPGTGKPQRITVVLRVHQDPPD